MSGGGTVDVRGNADGPHETVRRGSLGHFRPLRTGADAAPLHSGAFTRPEAAARGVVAFLACDIVGTPMVEIAPLLGVGTTALVRARRRGRARLAQLGLSPSEVLARSCGSSPPTVGS